MKKLLAMDFSPDQLKLIGAVVRLTYLDTF